MFFFSDINQENGENDSKIVLTLKSPSEKQASMVIKVNTNYNKSCLISPVISRYFDSKQKLFALNADVPISKNRDLFKERFKSLLSSVFNNEAICYSKKNYKILLHISKIFDISKLKTSVERYESYLNQLSQFNVGRLPLIDEEFLCQFYLHDLTYENIEDTKNASKIFIDHITVDTYGQILYECIYSRLSYSSLYLDFIINHMGPDYYPHFITTVERNHRNYSLLSGSKHDSLCVSNFLIRYFYENGYIKWDDIASFKYGIKGSYTYQNFDHDVGYIHYNAYHYVYRNYAEISKDNFALHRKLVLIGKNQNPLFKAIENDDIDNFQKMLAFNPTIDVDTTIDECYYEARPTFQCGNHSLIEIAAYFGSLKVFKYLLLNKATIREKELCKMAIYGGNAEIIRICKQNNISFEEGFSYLSIAIKMHHFDILRWLVEEEHLPFNYSEPDIFQTCIERSNFFAFYYLLRAKHDKTFITYSQDSWLLGIFEEEEEEAKDEKDSSVAVDGDAENKDKKESSVDVAVDDDEEEIEDERFADFHFDFGPYLRELVRSYNLPVLRNYVTMKDQNLLKYPRNCYEVDFIKLLFLNCDISLVDPLLKNNKIIDLETIQQIAVPSFKYQQFARFLLSNENVTFKPNVVGQVISDLNNYEEMKDHKEFVIDQIKFLYGKVTRNSDKICFIPSLLLYELNESEEFSQMYKDCLKLLQEADHLSIPTNNYVDFIRHTNVDMVKCITSKCDKMLDNYDVYKAINECNNIEMTFYFIELENETDETGTVYSEENFFSYFRKIRKVEVMNKFIHLFSEKVPGFYEDVFLPKVLFKVTPDQKEIIKYLLDLPEIEPYINKENKDYDNMTPLLYHGYIEEFVSNEKCDVNVRQKETNKSILSKTWSEDLVKLLQVERFKCTTDDVMNYIEEARFPGKTEAFMVFLNGLLYEDEETEIPVKIKFDFTDDQLTRIFNLLCITDDRVELAKRFYSKFSHQIDVNYINPKTDHYCLLDAIDCDSVKMVEFLLSISSLDLNRRGKVGYVCSHEYYDLGKVTPFICAVNFGIDEMINLFMKRKNDFDVNATYSSKVFNFLFCFWNYCFTLCS